MLAALRRTWYNGVRGGTRMAERICRCLLSEMEDERPLYEIIREYLATLPPQALADAIGKV